MKVVFVFLALLVACSSAQKAVVYIDAINSWWPPTAIAAGIGVPGYAHNTSFNYINLAFWLTSGGADAALLWQNAYTYVSSDNPWGNSNSAVQSAWRNRYNSAGIKIMISAFGATEFPTSAGVDPVSCGTNLANFVKNNNLDGVDLDWEDNAAMEAGKGEQWLISITKTLRNLLPKSEGYIISHAPQAPYFMGAPKYPNGGYLTVDKEVGDLIDFYNIQFYNQGDSTYDTYATLFESANGWSNGTAVKQLMAAGIPASRIVVGKPITTGDATNTGYVPVNSLASFFSQARSSWSTGFMGWQYKSDPDGSWSATLARSLGK